MKTIASLFAVLLICSAAQAQEESPAPTPKLSLRATAPGSSDNEPTVSVPSERSSSTYPRPGSALVSPTPKPQKKALSATEKARSTEKKKAVSPSPSPTAAATSGAAGVKDLENKWLNAIKSHDAAAVQTLVAEDYIGVSATGKVVTKSALIADMKADKNTYDSASNSAMTLRSHGDAVVIVGTSKQAGKDRAGKAFDYTYRWTDTWAQRNGTWQCIASQSIQVAR